MRRVEKLLFVWLVAMLVGVSAVGAYVVVRHVTRCDRFHFHAADWRHPKGHRNEIADRLVQCHQLEGLRSDELRAQLGPPQAKVKRHPGTVRWSYGAGWGVGFPFLTYRTLEVDISARGEVVGARITESSVD